MHINGIDVDSFTLAYIQCALWSGTDGDTPLDENHSLADIAPDSIQQMRDDCAHFQQKNPYVEIAQDLRKAGYNFWLTRNRHGAGFWDGDYPDDIGDLLTQASHAFGECNLIVCDGALHLYPM